MNALVRHKNELLKEFHDTLGIATASILSSQDSHQQKAQRVNAAATAVKGRLAAKIQQLPIATRTDHSLVLQYCFSVASIEYRHKVWQYEYMAFSRRVGELWEAFCSAAWDFPNRQGVKRLTIPTFAAVRQTLQTRLQKNIGAHQNKAEISTDIDILFEIIGEINMIEDEVFSVDNIPHVIDFKSGFGSNEKGNMLRLQTVGKAYRIWNHQTRLMLLVRQDQNNNYLKVLKRTGLWEVHTGANAYRQISDLTGANVEEIRKHIIDWPGDLSQDFYRFLKGQRTDLTSYLVW